MRCRCGGGSRSKQAPSFSEEKEAKRLSPFAPVALDINREKFFGSFFQKRTRLLC
jgi:hypothetical protein